MKIGIMYRLAIFGLLTTLLWVIVNVAASRATYEMGDEVVKQVTAPTNDNAAIVKATGGISAVAIWLGIFGTIVLFAVCLWTPIVDACRRFRAWGQTMDLSPCVLAVLTVCVVSGCAPYDTPEYQEISNSETGFLVQLSGATSQGKFESKEYLESKRVATKRVQIPHEFVSTGRMWYSGEWRPTHRLIKVDRTAVTRKWNPAPEGTNPVHDMGIWVESADSVGFSIGIELTCSVLEEDAATFLYHYPAGSLANVADSEIRSRIQKVFSEEAGKYAMSPLRAMKSEVIKAIETDVIAFFKVKGVTVTTIAMAGGFTYENKKIQESIDNVFIAQQEKEVNAAKLAAQQDANARVESEAKATANAAMEKARGEAEGQKLILAVAKEASTDPVFLRLKQLEVTNKMIEKWDGRWPSWYMGNGAGGGGLPITMMLQPPELPESVK